MRAANGNVVYQRWSETGMSIILKIKDRVSICRGVEIKYSRLCFE